MKKSWFFLLIAALGIFSLPNRTHAASFVDNLLSDHDLVDVQSMNLTQIQEFLNKKGVLGYYYAPDTDGVTKTAAEILHRVAQTYVLSPKFLLALMQREQSLIESKKPTERQYDWATGFGVCDACSKESPEVLAWKGFAKQVDSAAKQVRNRYLPDLETKGTTVSGIGPGVTKVIDGVSVTPQNKATAILYTYTPHLHGNENFYKIWQRWFALHFPDGSLVRVPATKDIWLLSDGERRLFGSRSAFLSRFQEAEILPITQQELDAYALGKPILFSNYSLLQNPAHDIFLIVGDEKRKIASPEVFRKLGFNPDEVETVSDEELSAYADGEIIEIQNAYPEGALLQDRATGGVYYVQDGKKYPLWGRELLNARFPKKPLSPATKEQLATFETGEPVKFRDGQLIGVKGQTTIYVIEHGMRRPIQSEEVFHEYGWQWQNVIWTGDNMANLHPLGEPIDIQTIQSDANLATL